MHPETELGRPSACCPKRGCSAWLLRATMNLASPAPQVEAAVAEKAVQVEPAVADMAPQSEAIDVGAPERVGPAVPFDDPLRHAPDSVAHPKKIKPDALSVQVLRGQDGTTFESYAAILRGAHDKNFLQRCLPCILDERDFATYGELKKYCLVHGDCCFVYGYDTDNKPLFAIPLDELYPIYEDPENPDKGSITVSPMPGTNKPRDTMVTVLLKFKASDMQEFQFTFDTEQDPTLAKRFFDIVQNLSQTGMQRAK
jgi:hypothetical protein